MLTLTCEKCGVQSHIARDFHNKSFEIVGKDGKAKEIHLCYSCQGELLGLLLDAVARWLEVPSLHDMVFYEGITHA